MFNTSWTHIIVQIGDKKNDYMILPEDISAVLHLGHEYDHEEGGHVHLVPHTAPPNQTK